MVSFDDDEIEKSDRANAALLLGVPQSVIDEMPEQDVLDLFARHNANSAARNELMKRK